MAGLFEDPKEYLDPETGEVIGVKTYGECVEQGLVMPTADMLLFRDGSYRDLLLQRRAGRPYISREPGLLHIPSGFLEPGEDRTRGAYRELEEEMYADGFPSGLKLERLFTFYAATDGTWSTVFRGVHPGPFALDPEEVASVSFRRLDRVLREIEFEPERFTEKCRLVLRAYAARCLTRG